MADQQPPLFGDAGEVRVKSAIIVGASLLAIGYLQSIAGVPDHSKLAPTERSLFSGLTCKTVFPE